MVSFIAVALVVFLAVVSADLSKPETSREHKYAPKVNLLRPNGFSVTVEGLLKNKQKKPTNNGEKPGGRHKRELHDDTIFNISQRRCGFYDFQHNGKRKKDHNKFVLIKDINKNFKDKQVLIRGRLQTSRTRGKQSFIVLRQQDRTIQCFLRAGRTVSQQMVKFVSNVSRESVIDVIGKVQVTTSEIRSCSQKWVEVLVEELWVVSVAELLPIQLVDCARTERSLNTEGVSRILNPESLNIYVNQDKKLDYRVIDLRTPANQAIFRIESAVCRIFRETLSRRGFIEIHTPKIISAASEGGANVFAVSYFKTCAYLAQSPQMYKQMAIAADFEKVFTVGSVFRAEESHTSRHLTEFVGLDLEMAFKFHYSEVMDVIEQTFIEIFRILQADYSDELATIQQQFYSEPFEFADPPPRITYAEGVQMLQEVGADVDSDADLTFQHEKLLGELVKEKYQSDFYTLYHYPISARPFYVMPDPDNQSLSNSYDMFMRGEEVMSGGQRIQNADFLKESAVRHGIQLDKIQSYIEAFRYGCPPHAGGGIGLERLVSLFIGLDNIRKTSMFPRDPKRVTP